MKLGIIGSGLIVKEALPVLEKLGIGVRAMCGTPRSAQTVCDLCERYGIPRGYTQVDELLADPDVDTVYVAVPNHLHHRMARAALEAGRHVILEKPFCRDLAEAEELAALARGRGLFLLEAITTNYLPELARIREWLPRIGEVRLATCNYSQYSRRYDAFRRGEILPVFDVAKAGGALMDLNVYNVHFVAGLFGAPEAVAYRANIERGVDTSGVLTMDYPGLHAVCVAAKDCAAPSGCVVQGTKGWIRLDGPSNAGGRLLLRMNDGEEEAFDPTPAHRMEAEFRAFRATIDAGDPAACLPALEKTLRVMDVLDRARASAGIMFPE